MKEYSKLKKKNDWINWIEPLIVSIVLAIFGIYIHYTEHIEYGMKYGSDFPIFYDQIFDYTKGFYYLPHFGIFFWFFSRFEFTISMNLFFVFILICSILAPFMINKEYKDIWVKRSLFLILLTTAHYEFGHLNLDYFLLVIFLYIIKQIRTQREIEAAFLLAFTTWKINFLLAFIPIFIYLSRDKVFKFIRDYFLFLFGLNLYYIIRFPEYYPDLINKFLTDGAIINSDNIYYLIFRNRTFRDYHLNYLIPIFYTTLETLTEKINLYKTQKKYNLKINNNIKQSKTISSSSSISPSISPSSDNDLIFKQDNYLLDDDVGLINTKDSNQNNFNGEKNIIKVAIQKINLIWNRILENERFQHMIVKINNKKAIIGLFFIFYFYILGPIALGEINLTWDSIKAIWCKQISHTC